MAFNWQTFRTRTLTAAVFVVVMLTGLLWNQWSFFILFSIIHFGCWWEYQRLIGLIDKRYQQIILFHKYGIILIGYGIMLFFTSYPYLVFGWLVGEYWLFTLPILFFAIYFIELVFLKRGKIENVGYSLLGLLYISLNLGLMFSLKGNHFGIQFQAEPYRLSLIIPIILIFSLWINDTMAYIVGSLIGKTPLSKISPRKTWEGTILGIILSTAIIGFVIGPLLAKGFNLNFIIPIMKFHWFFIAAITSIAGTFGDLLESKLKRMAAVKDSGHIMPGHGGFLDRFDSMLLAIPAVWLYVYFFIQ